MSDTHNTPLHDHILRSKGYYAVYERYQSDEATLAQVAATRVTAHVRIYYSPTCGECIRHIPALARIAEHLPAWTWELISSSEARLKEIECGLSTPIIAVSDSAGALLGAINGNPLTGSLETDLLHIITAATKKGQQHAVHPANL
jgi:hypothetical protein